MSAQILFLRGLIVLLAGLAFSASAFASPELARDWGTQAEALNTAIKAQRSDIERSGSRRASVPAELRRDLMRFAATSDQLAVMIDRTEGPKDLRCIFRGMSEEVAVQLDEIDGAGTDSVKIYAALVRLEKAADDASDISRAAASVLAGTRAQKDSGAGTCPARAAAAVQSLR